MEDGDGEKALEAMSAHLESDRDMHHPAADAQMRLASPRPDIALAESLFDELRERTDTRGGITRPSDAPGGQIAHNMVRREAARPGLSVTMDAGCNLYMKLRAERRAPALDALQMVL